MVSGGCRFGHKKKTRVFSKLLFYPPFHNVSSQQFLYCEIFLNVALHWKMSIHPGAKSSRIYVRRKWYLQCFLSWGYSILVTSNSPGPTIPWSSTIRPYIMPQDTGTPSHIHNETIRSHFASVEQENFETLILKSPVQFYLVSRCAVGLIQD